MSITDRYEINGLGVEVISVSVDSQFVHKVWNDTELSKMAEGRFLPYGFRWWRKHRERLRVYDSVGVDVRGRFIIDPDGVIQAMEVLTPPVGRNVDEMIRQIKAFQLVRETGGSQVTPSGWQPGGKVLEPGIELVAKVWQKWNPRDVYKK